MGNKLSKSKWIEIKNENENKNFQYRYKNFYKNKRIKIESLIEEKNIDSLPDIDINYNKSYFIYLERFQKLFLIVRSITTYYNPYESASETYYTNSIYFYLITQLCFFFFLCN